VITARAPYGSRRVVRGKRRNSGRNKGDKRTNHRKSRRYHIAAKPSSQKPVAGGSTTGKNQSSTFQSQAMPPSSMNGTATATSSHSEGSSRWRRRSTANGP
jgi:hypothetical protein